MVGNGKGAGHEEIGLARAKGLEQGGIVAGYMFSGLIAYGAIGWLIGRATHIQLLFPLGMVFGIAVSVGYVIYRFGRQGAAELAAGQAAELATRQAAELATRQAAGHTQAYGHKQALGQALNQPRAKQRTHDVKGSVKGMIGDR